MTPDTHPFFGARARSAKGIQRLALAVMPFHQYIGLRAELHIFTIRLRARGVRARYRSAKDLWVNIGAGSQGRPDWINVDMWPGDHVNCLYDCRQSLPFPSGSVAAIFSEHFLEHLDYTEETPGFLRECLRVLAPGGRIRIVVPDAEAYLRAYCESGWSTLDSLRALGPGHEDPWLGGRYATKMELVNAVFRQGHEHKYAYDAETLARALRVAGFVDIDRRAFADSAMRGLALDRVDRSRESLYIEAAKG